MLTCPFCGATLKWEAFKKPVGISSVHFCGDKPSEAKDTEKATTYTPAEAGDFEEVDDDDELPF